uniref:Uncharacterized protein n=1 Tax=viral metagenome TaxID=1070528 RepID=A0A6C0EIJ5_9ZZZZ
MLINNNLLSYDFANDSKSIKFNDLLMKIYYQLPDKYYDILPQKTKLEKILNLNVKDNNLYSNKKLFILNSSNISDNINQEDLEVDYISFDRKTTNEEVHGMGYHNIYRYTYTIYYKKILHEKLNEQFYYWINNIR